MAAGAGGASNQMARMMQAAIQKNNLMKRPIVVSLKGGASGAGIPGSGTAAILLGGLMVWSLNPGPLLFVE